MRRAVSTAHLSQAAQQRSRGARCFLGPDTGPVPGHKWGGTPNRAQDPTVAGDRQCQRNVSRFRAKYPRGPACLTLSTGR